jgi:hypothetical protein
MSILICLFVPPSFGHSQETLVDLESLRYEISSFLTAWLVKKDTDSSLGVFSSQAFRNPALLSSDCAGLSYPEPVPSPNDRREGVGLFLREFSEQITVENLEELLSIRMFEESHEQTTGVINDWKTDGYLLGKLNKSSLQDYVFSSDYDQPATQFMLGELKVSPLYWNVVILEKDDLEGGFEVIWKQEDGRWKIVHIDLICQ